MTPVWTMGPFWLAVLILWVAVALYWGFSRWLWGSGVMLILIGASGLWPVGWVVLLPLWVLTLLVLALINLPEFRRLVLTDRLYRRYRRSYEPEGVRTGVQERAAPSELTRFASDRLTVRRLARVTPHAPLPADDLAWIEAFPERLESSLARVPAQNPEGSPGWVEAFSELGLWGLGLPKTAGGRPMPTGLANRALAHLAARQPAWALLAARTVFSGCYELAGQLANTSARAAETLPALARGVMVMTPIDLTQQSRELAHTRGIVQRRRYEGRDNVIGVNLECEQWDVLMVDGINRVALIFEIEDPQHLLGDFEQKRIGLAIFPRTDPALEWRLMSARGLFESYHLGIAGVFQPLEAIAFTPEPGWDQDPVASIRKYLRDRMQLNRKAIALGVGQSLVDEASAWTTIMADGLVGEASSGVTRRLARMAAAAFELNQRFDEETAHWNGFEGRPYELSVLEEEETMDLLDALLRGHAALSGVRGLAGPFGRLAGERARLALWLQAGGAMGVCEGPQGDPDRVLRHLHELAWKERQLLEGLAENGVLARFDRLITLHAGRLLHHAARCSLRRLTGMLLPLRTGQRDAHGTRAARRLAHASSAMALLLDAYFWTVPGLTARGEQPVIEACRRALSEAFLVSALLERWRRESDEDPLRILHREVLDEALGRLEEALDQAATEFQPGFSRFGLRLALVGRLRRRSERVPSARVLSDLIRFPGIARNRLLDLFPQRPGADETTTAGVFEAMAEIHEVAIRLGQAMEQGLIQPMPAAEVVAQAVSSRLVSAQDGEQLVRAWQLRRRWLETGGLGVSRDRVFSSGNGTGEN